jgi:2-polyprenyl-3-methyl-5-hydroxy-6-metoxy-1,4-benzoquinol methylase
VTHGVYDRTVPERAELPYDPDQVPRGERAALLDRTSHGAQVLDVGCWSGFNGRYLQACRAAVVDGIEPHGEMAAKAALSYRHVVNAPAETALAELRDVSYDAMLFMDVLEHLVDPLAVLRPSASMLAPGGRILISLPNIAHWSIRRHLLAGHWRYQDSGLLDRTHLRFFTIESALELIEAAGLRPTWRSYAIDQPPGLRLSEERLSVLRRWPGLFAVQLLFEAVSR